MRPFREILFSIKVCVFSVFEHSRHEQPSLVGVRVLGLSCRAILPHSTTGLEW